MVNYYPDTGTQGTSGGDNETRCATSIGPGILIIGENGVEVARYLLPITGYHLITIGAGLNKELITKAVENLNAIATDRRTKAEIFWDNYDRIKPKQPCFTERGHSWWMHDKFLPGPAPDLNMRAVACGCHSPPITGDHC